MRIRFGPARVPTRESPEAAVALLLKRGYTACEIDFEGGFWMKDEWAWAKRFGELAAENGIALSVHAPIAAILGHESLKEVERYTKGADQKKLAAAAMSRLERQDANKNSQTTDKVWE